ncbi:MAG: hypothetical protein A2557_02985 [Candidatus Lambdaproteobacteria bacterium RIFOXYD2_FULL_56_26]|uniref:DUF362 domain-containing protein n=1 Tax=Candidatus Lambdaproteobacteria bacterium RIFOXYD2_FULL_56_26 TaxID=1817773 RepID=A0A1F6GXA0_9PROT|nr:MAG: hypothetical protein A2557_02985 [Candidatus Lambdaproteobacteria bacterium RIFOXYD2_FULL_56_26]
MDFISPDQTSKVPTFVHQKLQFETWRRRLGAGRKGGGKGWIYGRGKSLYPTRNRIPTRTKMILHHQKAQSYEPLALIDAMEAGLGAFGGLAKVLDGRQSVLLKPNFVTIRPKEAEVCTRPEVILALLDLLLDLGVKVAIGESPGFGSTEGAIEALGLTQALQHRAVPFFTFTQVRYYRTRIPKFPVLAIAKELSDYDGTINLPKVKTHCQTGFSGAVKNLYGCVPGKRKAIRHMTCLGDEVAFVQMILANAKEAGAFFHLADGIRCLHNHGPTSGDPHELHSLLFCEDGATLDWGLCGRIGLDPLSTLQFQLSGPPPVYVSSGEPIEPDPSFLHAAKVPVFFHPLRVARSIARQAWTKAKESVQ